MNNYFNKKTFLLCFLFCNILVYYTVVLADSNKLLNPQNGHYYQRFDQAMTWHDAVSFCESKDAHLVTITSQDETSYIVQNFQSEKNILCWIGATDEVNEGEWKWITNEEWSYTNWGSHEPNNGVGYGSEGMEHYIHLFWIYQPNGKWNDIPSVATIGHQGVTYQHVPICEWEASEEPVYSQETGHYYQAVRIDEGINWNEAKEKASKMSFRNLTGHLATITSQEENDFVFNSLGKESLAGYWLGGIQPDGSKEPDGNWQWITNEIWSYTNWGTSEPNNGVHAGGDDEEALQFHPTSSPPYTWNDLDKLGLMPGFVVEYELGNSDCKIVDTDNDGVIDQWDNCPNTLEGLYTDKNGCPINDNYPVSGNILMEGHPVKQGKAMLIQSGEIHQNCQLDLNGVFKFNSVDKEKPFSVIIRRTK